MSARAGKDRIQCPPHRPDVVAKVASTTRNARRVPNQWKAIRSFLIDSGPAKPPNEAACAKIFHRCFDASSHG